MLSDAKAQEEVEKFMHGLIRRNPGETEFHQAVREVAESLMPFILEHKEYQDNAILERLTEPDRIIIFRVCWQDDHGSACEPGLPCAIQQHDWTLQRGVAFSSIRYAEHP